MYIKVYVIRVKYLTLPFSDSNQVNEFQCHGELHSWSLKVLKPGLTFHKG